MLPQGTRPGFSIPLFAFGGMLCAIAALLGISLGTGWMVGPHMCLWNDPVSDECIQDFPWTLSLHRRWCPSASHHPLTFLFLLALTFPLPSPFLSLGLSLCRPPCPSASPHSNVLCIQGYVRPKYNQSLNIIPSKKTPVHIQCTMHTRPH